MAVAPATHESTEGRFFGLRMNADDFLDLPDDGCNYELIDGVVVMSPSPKPIHQAVAWEISIQLGIFLREHPIGRAFSEIDIHLGQGPSGEDVVYKPEIVFIKSDRLSQMTEKIVGGPDLVVEVVSRGSRRMDMETKRNDYEKAGVKEYWLIDPERSSMIFYRLEKGLFAEIPTVGPIFTSQAVQGFGLDLDRVRDEFKPW